jgi:hypothetical protein
MAVIIHTPHALDHEWIGARLVWIGLWVELVLTQPRDREHAYLLMHRSDRQKNESGLDCFVGFHPGPR